MFNLTCSICLYWWILIYSTKFTFQILDAFCLWWPPQWYIHCSLNSDWTTDLEQPTSAGTGYVLKTCYHSTSIIFAYALCTAKCEWVAVHVHQSTSTIHLLGILPYCRKINQKKYVSLRLRMQNAVPAQPCVGKLGISLVLLNFLHCNFRLWLKTT